MEYKLAAQRERIDSATASDKATSARTERDQRLDRTPQLYKLQDAAVELLPQDEWPRLHDCLRKPIRYGMPVQIRRGRWGIYYMGLRRCELPWVCPVCARAASTRNATEIRAGAAKWEEGEAELAQMTLTLSHKVEMPLTDVLGALETAFRLFSRGRRRKTMYDYGIRGTVRGLEIVHSKMTGWHPHYHILLFIQAGAPLEEMESYLGSTWSASAKGAAVEGVFANELGFDLRQASASNAGYLSKGVVSAQHLGSRTPWDMLEDYHNGDLEAGQLFLEYAECSRGKHRLSWTPGFRVSLGLEAYKPPDKGARRNKDEILCTLNYREWYDRMGSGATRSPMLNLHA